MDKKCSNFMYRESAAVQEKKRNNGSGIADMYGLPNQNKLVFHNSRFTYGMSDILGHRTKMNVLKLYRKYCGLSRQ